jgi:AraC-like DNA-binding protein
VGVTAAGIARIAAGSAYPPPKHPADHHFSWERGRQLEAFQILLVVSGRGWFETKETGLIPVEAGTAFMLFPRVWHRYRPDPETGWEESWVEMQGPVIEELYNQRVLDPSEPIRRNALAAGLDAAIEAIHSQVRALNRGFDPELSALALNTLTLWDRSGQSSPQRSRLAGAVSEAEHYLANHLVEPVNIEALARRLGVAYSHFRRAFKQHTGYAPWQYVIQQRLVRARRLLAASDITLDEAAERLGFSSAFHLSSAFKQVFRVPPDRWRRQLRAAATEESEEKRTRDA